MLFSHAPRLLWRSFKYLVYIAPWASARGAFAFQSGPYMRAVYGFFISSPHYAHRVQVSSGFAPSRARGISSFFKFLRPYAHAHKRFNVSRHSRFSPLSQIETSSINTAGELVPIWDDSRAAFTSTCRVATNCRNSSMATEGPSPMMRCVAPMRQIVASVLVKQFYKLCFVPERFCVLKRASPPSAGLC